MLYTATQTFIYRARLYRIGKEITSGEYARISRDKVANKRGILSMITPLIPEPETEIANSETDRRAFRKSKQ